MSQPRRTMLAPILFALLGGIALASCSDTGVVNDVTDGGGTGTDGSGAGTDGSGAGTNGSGGSTGTSGGGGSSTGTGSGGGSPDDCVEGLVDDFGNVPGGPGGCGAFASNSTDVFYGIQGSAACGSIYHLPSGTDSIASFGNTSWACRPDGMTAAEDALWLSGTGPVCPPLRLTLPSGSPKVSFPGAESGMQSIVRLGDHVYFDSVFFQGIMRMPVADAIPELWAGDDDGTTLFFVQRLLPPRGGEVLMLGRARTSSGVYRNGVLARDPEAPANTWRPIVVVPEEEFLTILGSQPVVTDDAVYLRTGSAAEGWSLRRVPLEGAAVNLADAPVVHTAAPGTRLILLTGGPMDTLVFVEDTNVVAAPGGLTGMLTTLASGLGPGSSPVLGAHVQGSCLFYAPVVSGSPADNNVEVSIRRTRIPGL